MTLNESADTSVSQNNTDTDTVLTTQDTTTEVSQTPVQSQDDNKTANTSDAGEKTDAKEKSLLDVVKDVVRKGKESSTAKPEGETSKEIPETDALKKDKEEPKKENTEEDTRFDKHPRFIKQQEKIKTLSESVDKLKPWAEKFEETTKWIESQNLTADEVKKGFDIMALMKNNPEKALHALAPYFQGLQEYAGIILPKDLQQKVDEGQVERALAQELARTRNAARTAELMADQTQKRYQSNVESGISQAKALQINQSVTRWQSGIISRDPDYARKEKHIVREVKAILNGRNAESEEEAIRIANQAYETVTRDLADLLPKKVAVTPTSTSSSSANRSVISQPKTLLDAARNALLQTNST